MNAIENFFVPQNPANQDMGMSVYFDCLVDDLRISLHSSPQGGNLAATATADILPPLTGGPSGSPWTGGWVIDRGLHHFSWYAFNNNGVVIPPAAPNYFDIYLRYIVDNIPLSIDTTTLHPGGLTFAP